MKSISLVNQQFLLYKKFGKKSQVLPDSLKEGISPPPSCELQMDERFLIGPQLISVGSKIGEGAHGKVYKGKYVYLAIVQLLENFMFCSANFLLKVQWDSLC